MQQWKFPPIVKIYEALGAVADGRVAEANDHSATVTSSSGDKNYTVEWADNFEWITSNDNASFWQGYVGYPIIAVLLKKGVLHFDEKTAEFLKGVPWKKINTKHKNKFDKTIDEVLENVREHGGDPNSIIKECQKLDEELRALNLQRPAKKRPPPKPMPKPDQGQLL